MASSSDQLPSVLVTGGARRIGGAVARIFGEHGWHVIIHHGHSSAEAAELAFSLPSAETIACDLANGNAAVAMIEELAQRLENWRVLVNCAAVFEADDACTLSPPVFDHAMQVNAATPARLAQTFLARARAAGGRRVIQITDQKLANPNPDFFSYSMSKHAVAATVPMLAMGAARPDDRIYALAPGAILPSYDQTGAEADFSHRLNLLHRRTSADEVAQAALFLAGGWLANGQTLYVDSGQHLLAQSRDVIYLGREDRGQTQG